MLENNEEFITLDDVLVKFDYHFNNYEARLSSPELDLMISVLLHSVIDYLSPKQTAKHKDARFWLYEEEETEYLYNFSSICKFLEINRENFRLDLLKVQQKGDNAKKIRELLHLNPSTGFRNKIKPRKDEELYD